MKLTLRYIKLTKPRRAVLPLPADKAEKAIKSAENFTCSKNDGMLILAPKSGGENIIAARLKAQTDGESTKIEYVAAFDLLRFLAQNAVSLFCFAASVTLLLVSLLGNMQIGLMWIVAALAAVFSLMYTLFSGKRIDKQDLKKEFEDLFDTCETALEEETTETETEI